MCGKMPLVVKQIIEKSVGLVLCGGYIKKLQRFFSATLISRTLPFL